MQCARDTGVGHFLTISTRLREAQRIIGIAHAYADVSASVGTHPDHASEEADVEEQTLRDLISDPKVVAIGECGLDYHNRSSNLDDQHEVFRKHIRVSLESGVPLVIHTREAEADTMRILREEASGQALKAVLHCFTSSRSLAEQAIDLGLYISFSGIVTFKNAGDIRETVGLVPLDRFLVETDAPFLAPAPYRGRRNEPAYVTHTADTVATLKAIPVRELAAHTTANFFKLFHRAIAPQELT